MVEVTPAFEAALSRFEPAWAAEATRAAETAPALEAALRWFEVTPALQATFPRLETARATEAARAFQIAPTINATPAILKCCLLSPILKAFPQFMQRPYLLLV
jgi:hypothetical protein